MHDLTYANKIITLLKEKIKDRDLKNRVTVNVALGPFTHVTPRSLRGALDALIEKEGLSGICLKIEEGKVTIKCRKCGVSSEITAPVPACPACGAEDIDIPVNEEFIIKSIEINEE